MLKNVKEILILLLVLIVGYQFIFPAKEIIEKPIITTITTVDTTYVNVVTMDTMYVPTEFVRRDTVMVPVEIDTVGIIKDYFSEYTYVDTLSIDQVGFGYLTDTIFMNRISSRSIRWDYTLPVITNTVETTITLPPRRESHFYLGATLVGTDTSINYFGPSIGFKTKGDTFFSLGAGVLGSGDVGITASAFYRFRPFKRFRLF